MMHLAAGDDVEILTSVRRAFVKLVPLMDGIIEVYLIKCNIFKHE